MLLAQIAVGIAIGLGLFEVGMRVRAWHERRWRSAAIKKLLAASPDGRLPQFSFAVTLPSLPDLPELPTVPKPRGICIDAIMNGSRCKGPGCACWDGGRKHL